MKRYRVHYVILWVCLGCYVLWIGIRVWSMDVFKEGYEAYVWQTAYANTVERAYDHLATAVAYVEREGMTHGFTSIVYETPDEDVGAWYAQLTLMLQELKEAKEAALGPEEAAHVLDVLRDRLLVRGERGEKVVAPPGVEIYGWNRLLALFASVSISVFCFMVFYVLRPPPDYR